MTVLICLVIKPNSDIAMNPRNIRSTLSLPADKRLSLKQGTGNGGTGNGEWGIFKMANL